MPLYPPALHTGDTIATVATSNWIPKELIEQGRRVITRHGYKFYTHPNTAQRHNQQAGTARERAQALNDAFAKPDIKAIILTAGGDRALHILDYLDYDLIKDNPKIICGYSDATAILSAIYTKTGLTVFHGADLHRYAKTPPESIWQSFENITQGTVYTYPMTNARTLRPGKCEGVLYGGNLCLLSNLWQTGYAPDLTGKILFIEDEKESYWNIDRMLLYARRVGGLDKCKGLITGGFSECADKINSSGVSFGHTIEGLLLEHTEGLNIPVITDAPFGHLDQLYTFPIGGTASLDAAFDQIKLHLTAPAVATPFS